jgi:hypothetical protein
MASPQNPYTVWIVEWATVIKACFLVRALNRKGKNIFKQCGDENDEGGKWRPTMDDCDPQRWIAKV